MPTHETRNALHSLSHASDAPDADEHVAAKRHRRRDDDTGTLPARDPRTTGTCNERNRGERPDGRRLRKLHNRTCHAADPVNDYAGYA